MDVRRLAPLGVALWTATFSSLGLAQSPCEPMVARLVSAQGVVEARADAASAWRPAALNAVFCPGYMVRVGAQSRAALILNNDTILRLDQHTTLTLSGVENGELSWLDLLSGIAHFISRVPRALTVKTPFVNAAVEGTEFVVAVAGNEASVTVFEGRVWAENEAGRLVLDSGQTAVAQAGQAPVARVVVRPRDAVQWALYYPPIFDRRLAQAPPAPWQKAVANSLDAYYAGDTVKAFAAIENVPEPSEARYFTHRAALHLVVGRVEEARADIERARQLDAQNAHAIALQSVIALAQNEKDRAFALAHQASELDPISVPALVALSYAQQGLFDIAAATMSMERAIAQDREDPLVWARLAELHLSQGDLDRALNAAQAAVALNPRSAHAQSMLGFAYLTRIEIDNARRAFEQSIAYDSTFPLARLGLGLAIIRTGDLAAGRREIEIAAALDPLNSLIRSYLGKAYYEEKRDRLADSQLAMAKSLDDKDPTPWFYDAIRKQTINRPVEALHDLQKSIELNDNRAVYRSRLLLDADLAARSASLGRIYRDLGFEQLALAEGYKSVNTDPTDHSGHRFLADIYSAQPHYEFARDSELLQSQLLQPINLSPVRPQTAANNLLIPGGVGPADPSFNEFNPLFTRDGFDLQLAAVGGSNNTYGDELIQSGLLGNFSYSASQFKFKTDGFRENNGVDQDIYNLFVQGRLSPKLSLQAELQHTDTEHGYLSLDFEPETFFISFFNRTERTDTYRIGGLYAPHPNSKFIASLVFLDAQEVISVVSTDIETSEEGYLTELQYLVHMARFDAIAGASHYSINSDRRIFLAGQLFTDTPSETEHTSTHFYSHIHYPSSLTLTLGASYDAFDRENYAEFEEFNPKFGMIWNPTPNTTFRLAAFKVLKRTLIADQTIEPTQVAGFNQLFDDANGTVSTRYGFAIDQKFSSNLYGGLSLSKRDLEVPIVGIVPGQAVIDNWEEELYQTYLNWTPTSHLAVSIEYELEKFEPGELTAGLPPIATKTQFLPIAVSYFHGTGFYARAKITHVDQSVQLSSGQQSDDFSLTDLTLGYRLPRQRGIFSIEVNNLFEKEFQFPGSNFRTSHQTGTAPPFLPERTIFSRFTLIF